MIGQLTLSTFFTLLVAVIAEVTDCTCIFRNCENAILACHRRRLPSKSQPGFYLKSKQKLWTGKARLLGPQGLGGSPHSKGFDIGIWPRTFLAGNGPLTGPNAASAVQKSGHCFFHHPLVTLLNRQVIGTGNLFRVSWRINFCHSHSSKTQFEK